MLQFTAVKCIMHVQWNIIIAFDPRCGGLLRFLASLKLTKLCSSTQRRISTCKYYSIKKIMYFLLLSLYSYSIQCNKIFNSSLYPDGIIFLFTALFTTLFQTSACYVELFPSYLFSLLFSHRVVYLKNISVINILRTHTPLQIFAQCSILFRSAG